MCVSRYVRWRNSKISSLDILNLDILIDGSLRYQVDAAKRLVEAMKGGPVKPAVHTYTALMDALAKASR